MKILTQGRNAVVDAGREGERSGLLKVMNCGN